MCWLLTFVGLVAPKEAVVCFLVVPKRTVGCLFVITASLNMSRPPAAALSSCNLP